MFHRVVPTSVRWWVQNTGLSAMRRWVGSPSYLQPIAALTPSSKRFLSLVSQMEDTSEAGIVDSHKEMEKQRAIKVILRYDRDRPRYKEKVMSILQTADCFSEKELCILLRHLYQKKHYDSIMDLTEILHLLNHTYPLKHTAEIIIKAASEQKNIRVANLMSDLISPDPFSASIHSTEADYPSSNPIREGDHLSIASFPAQEVSALLSVGKLPEARCILQSWSISRLCSPLVFTCLLTGFVTGGFAAEAIGFYAWCRDHTLSPKEATALLNTVSVSLLVQAYQEKKQPDNALTVFEQARAARVPLTVDVFEAVVGLLDGNHLWRAKYRELIRRAEYADRGKREALQAALVLEQLRRAVEVARGCAELSARMERCVHRRRDGRGVVIEGSRLSPALLRVSVLDLLLSQSQSSQSSLLLSSSQSQSSLSQSPSQAKPPQRGTVCVKVGRSAEKEQALEKLLLSDLQPPIHFRKEEKATVFVGGVKKVSVVSYVLDHGDVSTWREARKDSEDTDS
ncbi:hypothetical protein BLSTO_02655 [Blastocystis sp. subtype 1]